MKSFLVVNALFGCVQLLNAQFVVDQNLGTLTPGAELAIQGDTSSSGGTVRDAAQFYEGVSPNDFEGNWGNERVYRFELTQPTELFLTSSALTGDPDFFLLESLSVTTDNFNGKKKALGALRIAPQDSALNTEESLGGFAPGVYYLVADSFDGFDTLEGPPPTRDATFSSTLIGRSATALDLTEDIGVLSTPEQPLLFTSQGSQKEVALALYDEAGTLLDTGDSEIVSAGLETGDYLVGVGSAETTFGNNFSFSIAGSGGEFRLSFAQGFYTDPLQKRETLNFSFEATSVKFYRFTIEGPPEFTDLGVVARSGEPLEFSFLESNFDTEAVVYDQHGFYFDFNDDAGPDVFQSLLLYSQGGVGALPPGVWYLGIGGYNVVFREHFESDVVGGGTTEGTYGLDYNDQTLSGSVGPDEQNWFRFEIAARLIPLRDYIFDRESDEVTLSWEGVSTEATYAIFSSTNGEDFDLVPGQSGLTGLTTTFQVDLDEKPKQLFQVREE